jgi:hypothetical protein
MLVKFSKHPFVHLVALPYIAIIRIGQLEFVQHSTGKFVNVKVGSGISGFDIVRKSSRMHHIRSEK